MQHETMAPKFPWIRLPMKEVAAVLTEPCHGMLPVGSHVEVK